MECSTDLIPYVCMYVCMYVSIYLSLIHTHLLSPSSPTQSASICLTLSSSLGHMSLGVSAYLLEIRGGDGETIHGDWGGGSSKRKRDRKRCMCFKSV